MSLIFAAQAFYRLAKDNMESTASRRTPARLYCPTAADLLQPYQRYPAIIQHAILAVDTRPEFINLTPGQKAVLRALLTRAEKSDGRQPIAVNYENASDEAGVSVKTIGRAVELLIRAGWLERAGEDRDAYGVFTYRKFRFSRSLCDLVGLPRRHRTSVSKPVNEDQELKDYRGTCAIAPKAKPEDIVLPPELETVQDELGCRRSAVAMLRGLACRAGHNLADLIAVARDYLRAKQIAGHRAVRYLEEMIRKPGDYAARAADLAHQIAEQAQVSRHRDRAAAYAGRQYRAKSGELVRIFSHAAEVIRDGVSIGTMAGQQMQRVYDDIEAGRLIAA
jgi:hypothetical protein